MTKCDVADLAHAELADLRAAIGLSRPGETIPLYALSARTGAGIAEVADAVAARPAGPERPGDDWFVTHAVRTAHGRLGAARLAEQGLPATGSLDERLAEALARSMSSSA